MPDAIIRSVLALNNAQFKADINSSIGQTKSLKSEFGALKGQIAAAFGTAAVIAFARESAREFLVFDKAMRNVNTIAQQTEDGLQQTTSAVKQLSLELGRPPADLANALYDINSAGFKAKDGLTVLEAASKAATGGISDAKTAAAATVGILNAYGLSAEHASDVNDILFQTVKEGVITYEQLANVTGKVISTSAAAGVQFDEVAAAMAAMTKQGIQADEAATALNRIMLTLIKPSEKLSEAFQEYTGTTSAAYLQTQGLGETMKVLDQITGGNAQSAAELDIEMRALKAALSLTGEGAKVYSSALGEIADESSRAGAAQKAFEEQTKSAAFRMEQLANDMKLSMVAIGEWVAKAGTGLANVVSLLGGTNRQLTAREALIKNGITDEEKIAEILAYQEAQRQRAVTGAKEQTEQERAMAAQKLEQQKLAAALEEYAKAKAEFTAKELTDQQKYNGLKQKILEAEQKLSKAYEDQSLTQIQRTELETQILKDRQTLKGLEEKLAKEIYAEQVRQHKEMIRLADEYNKVRMGLEEYLAAQWWKQLSAQEQLAELRERQKADQEWFLAMQEQGLENDAEYLKRLLEAEKRKEQMLVLEKDIAKQAKDASDSTGAIGDEAGKATRGGVTQLAEALKDINRFQMTRLVENMKTLRQALADIAADGGFPDINLPDLSKFQVPEWMLKGDSAMKVRNIIKALEGLALASQSGIDFAAISEAFNFEFPDMSKVDADGLVNILKATRDARYGELSIKVDYPEGGIPIDASSVKLDVIAESLGILAGLKGVIWA